MGCRGPSHRRPDSGVRWPRAAAPARAGNGGHWPLSSQEGSTPRPGAHVHSLRRKCPAPDVVSCLATADLGPPHPGARQLEVAPSSVLTSTGSALAWARSDAASPSASWTHSFVLRGRGKSQQAPVAPSSASHLPRSSAWAWEGLVPLGPQLPQPGKAPGSNHVLLCSVA